MDHQKVYNAIIQKARSENRNRNNEIYYEDHHIIPHCLEGRDDSENRVLLTAREHFICHKLLTYIYKGNPGLIYAFHRMCFSRKDKIRLSSRDYAYIRELITSIPNVTKGKTFFEFYIEKYGDEEGLEVYKEYKIRNKDKNVGEKNSMFGKKQRPESIEKNRISNSGKYEKRYGKEKADEMKQKLGEKSKGENNPMAGKSIYNVWVEKYGKEEADRRLEEYKNNKRNKIWIRNIKLNKSKQIKKEEIEKYLLEEWEIGRFPQSNRKSFSSETIEKQSIKRKEYWKLKKQNL